MQNRRWHGNFDQILRQTNRGIYHFQFLEKLVHSLHNLFILDIFFNIFFLLKGKNNLVQLYCILLTLDCREYIVGTQTIKIFSALMLLFSKVTFLKDFFLENIYLIMVGKSEIGKTIILHFSLFCHVHQINVQLSYIYFSTMLSIYRFNTNIKSTFDVLVM